MTPLLELPTVRERMHRLSVTEYHRATAAGAVSKNVELLRGLIVTKMAKSPLHEFIAHRLLKLLMALMPRGFEVRHEAPITLHDSEPEPDLSIVAGHEEDWTADHPGQAQLVIEVAVTSTSVDETKAEMYAEAGIPEYWLVRAEERTVDVYREPTPEGYRSQIRLHASDRLQCATLPVVTFSVADIFPRA